MLAVATVALAQDAPPSLRRNHVTFSGGLTWWGSYPVGDATATLRGNGPGASNPGFTLLRAETEVDASPGGEVRVGYAITRALSVEFAAGYQRPGLTTRISGDAEVPGTTTLDAEELVQLTLGAGATWQVPRVRIAGRVRPFLSGGGGYLRQLYRERTLVQTGRFYYAGAGALAWLRGGDGIRRSLGLRADARAVWRHRGVEFAETVRLAPSFGIGVFVEF